MRLLRDTLLLSAASALAVVALTASVSTAALRAPQIPLCPGSLQSYLSGVPQTINVLTDQLNAQVWTTGTSGNADFTLMVRFGGIGAANNIGVYNAGAPAPLFQVFPGAAGPGWYATLHFGGGNLIVTLFDQNSVFLVQTFYAGVNANHFGFYLQGMTGLFFSQDFMNPGGMAQVLAYAGTGVDNGESWVCFEDLPYQFPNCLTDFEDAVLLVESVVPVPARTQTWGQLKALYGH